jgi:tRNA1Val (adenine37-N6)-methyltransferase
MKVGIDGVLLGAWTTVENVGNILDIGTGTGLIALMLAQRTNAQIDAIDIDIDAVMQASENVANSPWKSKIKVYETALQDFTKKTTKQYDLIVSNPPYFINSTKTPSIERTTARHTVSLTHEELIENANLLLKQTGRICIILPVNEGLQCVEHANKKGLFCTRLVSVYPKSNSAVKRLLLEFSKQSKDKIESKLVIEGDLRHCYSQEFSDLAKDFYLKL